MDRARSPDEARWRVLVTCEHASPLVPLGVELGVAKELLETHISYDRGAKEMAEGLAPAFDAPLHLGRFSRLVADLNRREDNPAVIARETYGVPVPGNASLDAAGREDRIARFHRPYREAACRDALRLAARGGCFHLSIHSFDPTLDPVARAFDAGVLFDPARDPERTLAEALATELSSELRVRLNEPYAGTPEGLTSFLRAQTEAARYVGIEIEASQGFLAEPGAIDVFTHALSRALSRVIG